ncbi:MAG: type II toxin-antitoxin system VapC family toxin [Thermoanaerobaculia bacterium]
MKRGLAYLDSSAIVKLVAREAASLALFEFLKDWPERVSSGLARVEVTRALRRARASLSLRRRSEDVLARIALVRIDDDVLETASRLDPPELRSLDAIHVATALSLAPGFGVFVAYDRRLCDAARSAGLPVSSPA